MVPVLQSSHSVRATLRRYVEGASLETSNKSENVLGSSCAPTLSPHDRAMSDEPSHDDEARHTPHATPDATPLEPNPIQHHPPQEGHAAQNESAAAPPVTDESKAATEPATDKPATDELGDGEPAADKAASGESAAEAPASEPAEEKPAAEEPAAKAPASGEYAASGPAEEKPAAEEPAANAPAPGEHAASEPAEEKSAAEEPAASAPAAGKPAADAAAAGEPASEERASEEPASEEPASDKSITTAKPASKGPATEAPASDEPASEAPPSEEPAVERAAAADATGEEPAADTAGTPTEPASLHTADDNGSVTSEEDDAPSQPKAVDIDVLKERALAGELMTDEEVALLKRSYEELMQEHMRLSGPEELPAVQPTPDTSLLTPMSGHVDELSLDPSVSRPAVGHDAPNKPAPDERRRKVPDAVLVEETTGAVRGLNLDPPVRSKIQRSRPPPADPMASSNNPALPGLASVGEQSPDAPKPSPQRAKQLWMDPERRQLAASLGFSKEPLYDGYARQSRLGGADGAAVRGSTLLSTPYTADGALPPAAPTPGSLPRPVSMLSSAAPSSVLDVDEDSLRQEATRSIYAAQSEATSATGAEKPATARSVRSRPPADDHSPKRKAPPQPRLTWESLEEMTFEDLLALDARSTFTPLPPLPGTTAAAPPKGKPRGAAPASDAAKPAKPTATGVGRPVANGRLVARSQRTPAPAPELAPAASPGPIPPPARIAAVKPRRLPQPLQPRLPAAPEPRSTPANRPADARLPVPGAEASAAPSPSARRQLPPRGPVSARAAQHRRSEPQPRPPPAAPEILPRGRAQPHAARPSAPRARPAQTSPRGPPPNKRSASQPPPDARGRSTGPPSVARRRSDPPASRPHDPRRSSLAPAPAAPRRTGVPPRSHVGHIKGDKSGGVAAMPSPAMPPIPAPPMQQLPPPGFPPFHLGFNPYQVPPPFMNPMFAPPPMPRVDYWNGQSGGLPDYLPPNFPWTGQGAEQFA